MSHFPFTINMPWYDCLTSGPKKNRTSWSEFNSCVVVELLDMFLRSFSDTQELFARSVVCFYRKADGKDEFICSCQRWGVSCLCSIFCTADITGLYKVIKRAKRWIPLEKCPRCLCQAYDEGQRALRGRGNVGAISVQAPSGGTGN